MGAPLVIGGEVIGVLEVWRRRESVCTPRDIRRLVALADLAAIAFDNARQHEISSASKREAEVAHRALQARLEKVEHALVGQQALIAALIDGEQLQDIGWVCLITSASPGDEAVHEHRDRMRADIAIRAIDLQ